MFDSTEVQNCLLPVVDIDDAAIYAAQYISFDNLAIVAPQGANITTVASTMLRGSINKMMGDVIRLKKLTNEVKTVIDDFSLFDNRADFSNKNANRGRFVGFEIGMRSNSDLSLGIYKVSFQIDMPCPDLKLYLFHSETEAPVSVTPVVYTNTRSVQTFEVALNLNNQEGRYYLGYFESDLATGAQSINKGMNLASEPCGTCGGMEVMRKYYLTRQKYMELQPMYVDSTHLIGTDLFDTDQVIHVDTQNWGINFKASATCDISDFICRNKGLFFDALSMRFAIDIMEYMLMSTRNSAFTEKIKDGIIFLRDGDANNRTKGLSKKYEESIEALNLDLSGFNAACLPCAKNWSVRRAFIR